MVCICMRETETEGEEEHCLHLLKDEQVYG